MRPYCVIYLRQYCKAFIVIYKNKNKTHIRRVIEICLYHIDKIFIYCSDICCDSVGFTVYFCTLYLRSQPMTGC